MPMHVYVAAYESFRKGGKTAMALAAELGVNYRTAMLLCRHLREMMATGSAPAPAEDQPA